jgi:hypothetical protein
LREGIGVLPTGEANAPPPVFFGRRRVRRHPPFPESLSKTTDKKECRNNPFNLSMRIMGIDDKKSSKQRVLPRVSKTAGRPMSGIDITDGSALQELEDLEYVERMKSLGSPSASDNGRLQPVTASERIDDECSD